MDKSSKLGADETLRMLVPVSELPIAILETEGVGVPVLYKEGRRYTWLKNKY